MKKAGATDEAIAARVLFFNHRVIEELYDYEKDPDALNNLIDNPEYADVVERMRREMADHMEQSGDPALEVFHKRNSDADRRAFMKVEEEKSKLVNNSGLGRKRK